MPSLETFRLCSHPNSNPLRGRSLTGAEVVGSFPGHARPVPVPGNASLLEPCLSQRYHPMSRTLPNRGRTSPMVGLVFLLALGGLGPASAQELDLKRHVPGSDTIACPPMSVPARPGEEEQAEAGRLASSADQALILGDTERAREFLARATELDPSSAELAYRYGRILEDLGETDLAIGQFCRALALGSRQQGIGDARPRLEALARARDPLVPPEASTAFLNGLLQADLRQFQAAAQAFDLAVRVAPDWADALYNRGVVRARMGDAEGAVADLQQYLSLRPDAHDAILVSRRIGQLQITAPVQSPATTLTLGLLLPGMGQFYTGRAMGGVTVLALAGGAAAAGFLVEEVTVRCVGPVPSGGTCPPERFIGETSERPYLVYGLVAAGAVTFLGAIEAYIKTRRSGGRGQDGAAPTLSSTTAETGGLEFGQMDVPGAAALLAGAPGSVRLWGPSLEACGSRLNFNLLRISF
jgi:tetratricopeptide (TPR) repeat protein